MNLIINARDALPEGGEIVVEARNAAADEERGLNLAPGDYVVLTVADRGSGIPPDILEKVTEPFFTTKDVGRGTGLGLSMVYGFARQSEGAIAIDSALGAGTKVEIWLPRAPAGAARGEQRATADEEAPPPHAQRLRVLLVDTTRRCARPRPLCWATWAMP